MAIFPGDIVIKAAIEEGLADMKKNDWLIDDIMSQLTSEEYFSKKYGQAEIDNCKTWFKNLNIPVYLHHRIDKDELPYIGVGLGSSSERNEEKSMGDLSTEVVELVPSQINKPIPFMIKPFVPEGYDQHTGTLTLPSGVTTTQIGPGMILVNPKNGNGYVIQSILSPNELTIEPGTEINASKLAVVPQYQIYKCRRGHSFFFESYTVGIHVHGDPLYLIWLHSIILTILLRYRQSLLEGRQFAESSISSSDMEPSSYYATPGGENVFSRYITLTGQVENSWLNTPRRVIETVEVAGDPQGLTSGILILSQAAPAGLNDDTDWTTVDDE